MAKADVALEVVYPMDEPEKAHILTNMTREGVEEILEAWVRGEITRDKDEREPNRRDTHHIWIGVQLSDDTIIIRSDTGNRSVDLGIIVGEIFPRLADIDLRPFPPKGEPS